MTSDQPSTHYGRSLYRSDFTACGKEKALVVITFDPDKVTCGVCIEELKLQDEAEGER